MNKEVFLDRLYELVPKHGYTALDIIRQEMEQEATKREEYFKVMADNNMLRLQRMVKVSAFDGSGNPRGEVDQVVEYLTVYYKDLPRFSKQAGIKPELVQAVAEGREKQFKDKAGNIWRGHPFVWVDNTPTMEERQEAELDRKEEESLKRQNAVRQANRQAAFNQVQTNPVITIYE